MQIKQDQRDTERDDLVNKALEGPSTDGGAKIQYKEYYPAYFSDITLYLTRNNKWNPKVISGSSRVKSTVTYTLTRERRK